MIGWKAGQHIQMLDLKHQHQMLQPALDEAIRRVVQSGTYIQGEEVIKFSQELSDFMGGIYVIPCGNGTDALQLAFMGLDLQPGDEIIVPSFNYVAAVEAAVLLGLVPVFAECHPETFCINPASVESCIGPKTRAIVAVHLFGQGCDMEALMAISEKNGLFLIEDNAQSIGAVSKSEPYFGQKLGTIGTVGTSSFFPSKNLGCMGDGGVVFCQDAGLAEKIRMKANHGQKVRYRYEQIGINSRLDALQAAILRIKLPHLERFAELRNQVAQRYFQWLQPISEIICPELGKDSNHVFHQFTIKLKDMETRNALQAYLAEFDIQSIIYYPVPIHLQPAYRKFHQARPTNLKVSESLSHQVLSLPIYPELEEETQKVVCDTIRHFFANR